MNELSNSDFFFCYTKKLSDHLRDKGFYYILKARTLKDENVIFTLYEQSEELNKAIKSFKKV